MIKFFWLIALLAFGSLNAQQLIINEISQGTGSSEYVEFAVIGVPTCITPVPTLDLRNVILDDNNGYFAPGSGTGIAPGAVRFANIPFWQNIPQGSYIVIYNNTSPNTSLPPDDTSLIDGNCRLIIPANSNLLEKTTVSPTTTNSAYPPNGSWITGGSWSTLAMANTDDSFQVPNIPANGLPFHSVSWGNNTQNTLVYFAGSAASKVFSFTNNTSNNWNLTANWTSADISTAQTPGAANNAANDAWIGSMNPLCSINPGMTLSATMVNETCVNTCDGSIACNVNNGVAPYTYSWSNGSSNPSISALCPGTYTLTATGANGCSVIESYTILAGTVVANANILPAGPFTVLDPLQALQVATAGGTWSSSCGTCVSSTGVFDPQLAGLGTWQVCYSVGTGTCAATQCISIIVNSGCVPQITTENLNICPEDSVQIFGTWEHISGTYSASLIDVNQCDSTHIVNLNIFNVWPLNETIELCENDSIIIFNQWVDSTLTLIQQEQNTMGCNFIHTVEVIQKNCDIEEPLIYIPNSFTPNADLLNDDFEIIIQGGTIERGYIMNRWGEEIFTFSPTQLKWDGINKKTRLPVQDGIYTYLVYFYPDNQVREVYHGFVCVIR